VRMEKFIKPEPKLEILTLTHSGRKDSGSSGQPPKTGAGGASQIHSARVSNVTNQTLYSLVYVNIYILNSCWFIVFMYTSIYHAWNNCTIFK